MTGIRSRSVAVVIGAGSVKCAAAIGLYNVLKREQIAVDRLVGCSAGSIYAALMANGFDGSTAAEMTMRLWTEEITGQRNRRALLSILFPRLFGFGDRFGMRSDTLIMSRLKDAFGEKRIEDAQIPLHITATDFRNGEQVVMSEGSLVQAIRASIAIPFIFAPIPVGDRLLMDGFLSDPLPIGVAMREGSDIIIAMGFESPYQSRISSPTRFAFQLSSIMTNNLLKSTYAFHNIAHHAEIIPIIPQFKKRVRLFDTARIPYIIEEGERAAEEQMPYLRRLLDAPVEKTVTGE
ncbi:MAG: patatin-like phospholipase family protein [Acidobacteriota bacterium]